jgi:chemotaxis protein MotB
MAKAQAGQMDMVDASAQVAAAERANYESEIAELVAERDNLAQSYQDLVARIGTGPALPAALESELSTFAAANADLIEFDADAGVVKFKSDVTFTSGDAELKPDAQAAIDRFAQILNGPVARAYELRVAGHTDNVANFSAHTRSKGHKNNWYLSSHRAISVAERLISQGVEDSRLGVLGFADQRPTASNATPTGQEANRRVEVLILPSTVASPNVADSQVPAPAEVEAMPASSINDDSGVMK